MLLSDAVLDRALDEMSGPNTKPSPQLLAQLHEIMNYYDGRRVTHQGGRFVLDRYHHRNRWVRAMRQTKVPMRLIDGPCDPNSGRPMADRYRQIVPNPDVVLLDKLIGHLPELEDPQAVTAHLLQFIESTQTTAADGSEDPARLSSCALTPLSPLGDACFDRLCKSLGVGWSAESRQTCPLRAGCAY